MATDVKAQIADKLLELAKKRGLDKVTVNQVVAACGISRQAFYYHYQDILDVARSSIRGKLDAVLARSSGAHEAISAFRLFSEEIPQMLPAVAAGINSKLRAEVEAILLKELKQFMRLTVLENGQEWGLALTRAQLEFRTDFFACGITAYIIEHCNDSKFDVDEFDWQMEEIFRSTPLR